MSITSVNTASSTTSPGLTSGTSASPDMFLTLLLAELQTQDPLSPMDTQAMVTQMSDMEMVSENRTSRQSQQFAQATSLIGKTVTWQDSNGGTTESGKVTAVTRDGSDPRVQVGSTTLTLDQLQSIS